MPWKKSEGIHIFFKIPSSSICPSQNFGFCLSFESLHLLLSFPSFLSSDLGTPLFSTRVHPKDILWGLSSSSLDRRTGCTCQRCHLFSPTLWPSRMPCISNQPIGVMWFPSKLSANARETASLWSWLKGLLGGLFLGTPHHAPLCRPAIHTEGSPLSAEEPTHFSTHLPAGPPSSVSTPWAAACVPEFPPASCTCVLGFPIQGERKDDSTSHACLSCWWNVIKYGKSCK